MTFVGQGNPERCLELLDTMLYKPNEPWLCNPKPCAIGGIYQPTIKPNATFFVLGAFVYSLKRMNVLRPDGRFSLRHLKTEAKKFCSTVRVNSIQFNKRSFIENQNGNLRLDFDASIAWKRMIYYST